MRNEIHVERKPTTGLGDVVAAFAKPIARALKLEGCGGCRQRQIILNRLIPDVRHPLKH